MIWKSNKGHQIFKFYFHGCYGDVRDRVVDNDEKQPRFEQAEKFFDLKIFEVKFANWIFLQLFEEKLLVKTGHQ